MGASGDPSGSRMEEAGEGHPHSLEVASEEDLSCLEALVVLQEITHSVPTINAANILQIKFHKSNSVLKCTASQHTLQYGNAGVRLAVSPSLLLHLPMPNGPLGGMPMWGGGIPGGGALCWLEPGGPGGGGTMPGGAGGGMGIWGMAATEGCVDQKCVKLP